MNKHQWAYEKFGWTHLDAEQRRIFETIEIELMPLRRDLRRLMEANLTNDQITGIFKGAEDLSRDKGLRTGFGKAVSFPKETLAKVNGILSNFGTKLQNSKPVAKADEMFDSLKAKFREKLEKNPKGAKILAFVDALGNAAKNKPVWQSAIIGLLTAVIGMSLGPATIPVVAFLLRGATELIKGEKLSTAVGKGLYAGALGYLSAQVASALMGWAESLRIANIAPVGPEELGFRTIGFSGQSTSTLNGMEVTKWFRISNVTVDPAMQGAINDTILRMGSGDLSAYDRLLSLARRVASPEYLDTLRSQLDAATANKISNDAFLSSVRGIKDAVVSAAGGAATAGVDVKQKEKSTPVTENPIMEGLWADLTLKFGAGKLNKAWLQAGRPTDSVDIAKMLASMGMEVDDIRQLMLDAGLSDEDVSATIKAMNVSDEEDEVPFKSGFAAFDDEAAKIFRTQGSDAFVKYWEDKVKELEDKANKLALPDKWPAIVDDFRAALRANDAKKAKDLLSSETGFSVPIKRKLLGLLQYAGMADSDKKDLADVINKATVTEYQIFDELTDVLKENSITWRDLGIQQIFKDPRTQTVIML